MDNATEGWQTWPEMWHWMVVSTEALLLIILAITTASILILTDGSVRVAMTMKQWSTVRTSYSDFSCSARALSRAACSM